jgi:hypothetical protein
VVDPRRALLSLVAGREVLGQAARTLGAAGIPLMPLKGVWLQSCVYTGDECRAITDVDVLVPEAAFDDALHKLEREGWRPRSGNVSECALAHPDMLLPIDVHRRLFSRGAFSLPTHALFRRGTPDESAFGVHVFLPDPRDALAHLVGHFVKSRTDARDPMRIGDFVAVARRLQLDPHDCARHLHAAGMTRAVRYAVRELATHEPFYASLLEALPRDPLGSALLRLARAASGAGPRSALGAAPGFLLDRSLAAGARALVLRAVDLRHERRPAAD